VIARSILDMWIELIVQTVVIALMQGLIVSFLLGAAATQNALVVLGVSLICSIFIAVLLWSGIKAVWNSFNRLFGAIGQATGGVMVAPGTVAVGAAAAGAAIATGGASLALNAGGSALAGASALNNGATGAQAAGVMLGGSRSLSAAARTLAYLPGLRGTDLGEAASEFTEGAMVRQVGQSIPLVGKAVGPLIGAHLLSDRGEKRKREDNTLTLPAEPVEGDLETTEGLFTPVRPRRMGTFTPLDASLPLAALGDQATQTRSAVGRVQSATEMQGEEVEEQVSAVGADVRSQAGQAQADRERSDYADDMHGEEVEDRISSLDATMHTGQTAGGDISALDRAAGRLSSAAEALGRSAGTQPMVGLMRVEGANNVAGVMGDFISQTRVQRTLDGQPMAGGTDHFTVAQGVARAMGVTPEPEDRAPIQGDVARLGLFGDQALKLGLTGQQAQTVITEVKASPTGELTPPTRTALVEQARGTLNTGWDGAQSAVNALQRAAAMLPNSVTARGTVSVPTINVQPQVHVNVSAPERSSLDQAMVSQAALAGSQNAGAQRGEA